MKPYYNKDGIVLYCGDSRKILPELRNKSFDLVLTDPPYPAKFSWCWEFLAEQSVRLLKLGGSLITFVGVINLEQAILACHGWGLTYHWSGGQYHNVPTIINGRRVQCRWKPNLWYTKGKHREMPEKKWPCDFLITTHREKAHHEWQQPLGIFSYWMSHLTLASELILDPFAGSGTTLLAAKALGRRAVGIEISEGHCASTVERLEKQTGFDFVVESGGKPGAPGGFGLRVPCQKKSGK